MKWSNKLVLLTGVAGFIGSHLLRRLIKLNAEVIAVDDLSVGVKENIKFFDGEFHLLDVSERNFVELMKSTTSTSSSTSEHHLQLSCSIKTLKGCSARLSPVL
jgi:nucleoside-diphosphate-sugar epimerase